MKIFSIMIILLVAGINSDYIAFMCHKNTQIANCPCDQCYQATGGPFGNYIQCGKCSNGTSFTPSGLTIDLGCSCDQGGHSYTLYDLFSSNYTVSCTTADDQTWMQFKKIIDSLYQNMTNQTEPYDWVGNESMCKNWAMFGINIGVSYVSITLALLCVIPLFKFLKTKKSKKNALLGRNP